MYFFSELMAKTKGDKVKTLEAKTNAVLQQGCLTCKGLLNTTTVQGSTTNLVKKLTTSGNSSAELETKPTATANGTILSGGKSGATEKTMSRISESSSDEDGYGSELLQPGHLATFVATTEKQNKGARVVAEKSPKFRLALSRKKNGGNCGSPQEHVSAFTRVAPKRQSTEDSEQANKRQRVLNVKPGPLNSGLSAAQDTKETFIPPPQPSAINTNFSNDVRLTRRRTRSMNKSQDSTSQEEKIIRLEAKSDANQMDTKQAPGGARDTARTKTVKGLKRVTHTNTSSNLTKIPHPAATKQESSKGKTPSKSSAFAAPLHANSDSNTTTKEHNNVKSSQLSKLTGIKEKMAVQSKVRNFVIYYPE